MWSMWNLWNQDRYNVSWNQEVLTSGVIGLRVVMCLGLYNGRCSDKSISLCMRQQQFTFRTSKNGILSKYKVQIPKPNTFIQKCKPGQSHSGYHH